MNILRAILNIRPGSCFEVNGNTYDGIVWKEPPVLEGGQEKPTREEVEAEVSRLQQEWEIKQYQRDRRREYPNFRDYLDGIVKGDAAQVQEYIDKCNAVKAKYPKP